MSDLWVGLTETGSGPSEDGRVTELGRHQAARDFPASEQLLALWTSLALQRGAVPSRHQIDPMSLGGALPVTFLLESVAPGVARFRVAGSRICDLMGMEVRGMPLISLFTPKSRDEISQLLQVVLGRLAQARLVLGGESGFGRPPLEGRMLLLPLLDDMGRATRAIGVLEFRGEVGRTPRRLEIRSQRLALLRSEALTPRSGQTAGAAARAAAAGLADPGAPSQPAATTQGRPSDAPAGFAETQRGFAPRRSSPGAGPDRLTTLPQAGALTEITGTAAGGPAGGSPRESDAAQLPAEAAGKTLAAGAQQGVPPPKSPLTAGAPGPGLTSPTGHSAGAADQDGYSDGAAAPDGYSGGTTGQAAAPEANCGSDRLRPLSGGWAAADSQARPIDRVSGRTGQEPPAPPARPGPSGPATRQGRLPPDIPPDASASPGDAGAPGPLPDGTPPRTRPWLRVIQGGKV